ncbi:MAG: glycosyltransferase family 39 protein [Elusimicrobiota bacterium]
MDSAQVPILGRLNDRRRFEVAVFALAAALRLGFLAVFQWKGMGDVYGRDLYYNLAQSWLGWAPMPAFDATHPPLYTALIAAVLGLFRSPNPLPVLLLQCVLGAGSVVLVARIGARLLDEKTARVAAVWAALDPALIFFTPHLQTETTFVAMELIFFLGVLALWDEPLSSRNVALGVWGGLCVLCRSMFAAYPAFLFLAIWRAKGAWRAFGFCALLGLGWVIPTGLWTARNLFQYGRLVPMSGQMGWTLYEGFTLDREEIRRRPYEMDAEATRLGITDSLERGAYFFSKTLDFARNNPLAAGRIVLGKTLLYWRPWLYDPYTLWQRWCLGIYYVIVFALALVGASAARTRGIWAPVWAVFIYLTAVHSIFFTSLRYRLPLEPFLCLLAASGAAALRRAWERHA